MNFHNTMQALALGLLLVTSPMINAAETVPATQKPAQQGFTQPEDAVRALAEAVRAKDVNALLAVLGPASRSWLASGDTIADRRDWEKFLAAYDRKHAISLTSDGRAVILVGDDDWPFPAPLVRRGDRWVFDAAAGREEIINRRIGRSTDVSVGMNWIRSRRCWRSSMRNGSMLPMTWMAMDQTTSPSVLSPVRALAMVFSGRSRQTSGQVRWDRWLAQRRAKATSRKPLACSRRHIMATVTGC